MINEQKLDAYSDAITEARRFISKAEKAMGRLRNDEYAEYGCKETASAKRASMDLTRSLAELRKR